MMDIAGREHSKFRGNAGDLEQFARLASSRIRSPEREAALLAWEEYKKHRQLGAYRRETGRRLTKADHVRALDARVIDLRGANLDGVCVGYADMRGVLLDDCSLRGAQLKGARLTNASFAGADLASTNGKATGLMLADLCGADFTGADMTRVDFSYAAMHDVVIANANLTDTVLEHATLVRANIAGARLVRTRIYGTAVWDVTGEPAEQRDLLITQTGDAPLHVDDLKVAQFVYLMLNNRELRNVIETFTTKSVLILGRFTPERKRVLDRIRTEVRSRGLVPIMFDFEPTKTRDLAETVRVLASLARFVIADLSDAKAVVDELHLIIPSFPSVPIQPLLVESGELYSMYAQWKRYPWVLPVVRYRDEEQLCALLDTAILPAIASWEANERASEI